MSYAGGAAVDRRGYDVISGVKAYFGRVNARGGVAGRQLVIETFDDQGDPRRHADGVRRLVRDKGAVAILGCVGDAICEASAGVAADLHVPLVAPLSGAASLSRVRNPYVFRVRAEYLREVEAVATQLAQLGCTRVAVLSDKTASPDSEPAMLDILKTDGITVTLLSVSPGTPAGLDAAMRALGAGNCQAVLTNLAPRTVDLFVDAGLSARDEWPGMIMTTANGRPAAAVRGIQGQRGRVHASRAERRADREPSRARAQRGRRATLRRAGGHRRLVTRRLPPGVRQGPQDSDWVEIGLRSRSGVLVN